MYERLTEQGRAVIAGAQAAAQGYNHNYVGTEHILLALVRTPGVAAEVLRSFGITADRVDAKIRELVGVGEPDAEGIPSGEDAPLASHGKEVIDRSNGEALRLGHERIDTEHILLALLNAPGGAGGRILQEAGADHDAIRTALLERIAPPGTAAQPPKPVGTPQPPKPVGTPQPPEPIRLEYTQQLRRLLMAAGARALDDGRTEIDATDVLVALTREEAIAPLLAQLGVDEHAVRDAIARGRP